MRPPLSRKRGPVSGIARSFFLLMLLLAAMSAAAAAEQVADTPIAAFHWLLGQWTRVDLPAGRSGDELWRVQDAALIGVGSSYREGVLRFREQLRIVAEGDEVFYVADVPGNPAPVKFRLITRDAQSAVFENLQHDYPQRIAYRRDGSRLIATISGNEREERFLFERADAPAR